MENRKLDRATQKLGNSAEIQKQRGNHARGAALRALSSETEARRIIIGGRGPHLFYRCARAECPAGLLRHSRTVIRGQRSSRHGAGSPERRVSSRRSPRNLLPPCCPISTCTLDGERFSRGLRASTVKPDGGRHATLMLNVPLEGLRFRLGLTDTFQQLSRRIFDRETARLVIIDKDAGHANGHRLSWLLFSFCVPMILR